MSDRQETAGSGQTTSGESRGESGRTMAAPGRTESGQDYRISRSMSAATATAAAAVARQRQAQPNGWWGMALFLCAEVVLFGTVLATYFYLDFGSGKWPPPGIKPPEVTAPLLATAWLVSTTVPIWLAARAARRGLRRATIWMITIALVMQLAYLAAQVLLFRHDLLQFSPKGSAYGSIYFTMLGLHHAHVVLGVLLDLSILGFVITRGLTNYWLISVRGLAMYWYVVNVLAVFVVLTQLSPSL